MSTQSGYWINGVFVDDFADFMLEAELDMNDANPMTLEEINEMFVEPTFGRHFTDSEELPF